MCGLYREWSNDGLLSMEEQLEAIKIMAKQIEAAVNCYQLLLLLLITPLQKRLLKGP